MTDETNYGPFCIACERRYEMEGLLRAAEERVGKLEAELREIKSRRGRPDAAEGEGMKVAINVCFGGFCLSHEANVLYAKRKGLDLFAYKQTKYMHSDGVDEYKRVSDPGRSLFVFYSTKDFGPTCDGSQMDSAHWYPYKQDNGFRTDPDLIAVIEELGSKRASGSCSRLKIVEIPNGVEWEISEYDGNEHIAERHSTWR